MGREIDPPIAYAQKSYRVIYQVDADTFELTVHRKGLINQVIPSVGFHI